MCANFGIERQGDWPAGAILAQANDAPPGLAFWICAQPVHLAINRDQLELLPPAQLHLPDAQSRTLFSAIESHCAGYGLLMKYIEPGLWCIGSPRVQDLSTMEIECVEGRSVNEALPSGADASWWQRLIVELQMVLHQQPVNMVRESQGEVPVNSIWIWGGGSVPEVQPHFDTMCVRHPLLRALARASQARSIEVPCNIGDFSNSDCGLIEIPDTIDTQPDARLSQLDVEWMSPAWEALGTGALDELNMVFALDQGLVTCRCDRRARRRFWKRGSALRRQLAQWQSDK